ncbi:dynein heavy chain 6, axonemal-like [Rhopalosiphum maidis]|uniref:dynein heavy chain 6, axonemal-like n=1 Tax=Rhopalosiphum maidis TaxID=43146 RepID=UPI000EFFBB94|nr:dynein heavy chain 6, axonemal-like [Rhopalosiphum maidis]
MVRLGNLTKLQCSGVHALITVDFHARDVISTMVIRKINSDAHFEWLKQLRYYWDNIDGCVAYSINTRWSYAFEYLGSSPRLVITPLTDRCYLCLMGALQLSLGCALSGPTGTGKTETAKDLAKALATQCIVFNCSDGLNYKTIGRYFSGLAQSGVWCCFDEFDRVGIEVLSVIAQQLITITNAKLTNANKFTFEGREIRLIGTCAVFITINPEYVRRSELPDNLQALFRPVAMMIPDYNLIAEVILYSEGFQSSKILSHKIVKMYQLCNEQLSIQKHYDFGMRAIKSVLIMAGLFKRENPIVDENLILIRALKNSNLPKFLKDDAELFQDILNDLFPGVFLPENNFEIFLSTAKSVMESEGYQIKESFYIKVIHLFQTIAIRHGIITVGQTGSGKTTILKILSKTLIELYNKKIENRYYKPVNIYRLNPKAISMNELYGQLDLLTMEWKDGLLGKIIRKTVQVEKEEFQWVVCDGPLDAIWIENLNSVLDDTKTLCLANSERIKLSSWVKMFFEVDDLSQASPATVSRCGVVYINTSDVGWLPYVHSWINKLQNDVIKSSTELKNYMKFLFKTYVDDGFSFINKYCLAPIKQVEISKATMMCTILESLLTDPVSFDASTEISKVQAFIYQSFIFSYLWSLGSNLVDSSQIKFENFVFNQFSDKSEYGILPEMKLFNVYLNTENKKFENWNTIVQNFVYKTNTPYYELLVPTVDSIRYTHVMQKIVQMNQPVMLTGTTGVGKTSVANLIMQDLTSTGNWISETINFSTYTNSKRTQKVLESKLVKKKRNQFGAPVNKRLALFIDDVNMPIPEVYGAQPPIELLRQLLDFGGIYDRDKLDWNDVENMILCTICTPPGGGHVLPPRFTRHFSIIYMPITSENSMRTIFTSILDGFLEEFPLNRANSSSEIVQASIEIYLRISKDLLPTPAKPHYVFNLRDLSKTIQGVLQANFVTIPDRTCLYRLWYHETLRVYHDRLICQKDRSYIFNLLQDVCTRYFNTSMLDISKYANNNPSHPPVLFGDFMDPVSKESRDYKEIIDIDQLKTTLIKNLTDFNMTYNKDMNIIFFMDAIEHITRIARILRSERGNALLVGVNLVGKQSLTKLSSHLNAYKCFQIEITKSYNRTDFREDLLNLYHNTGVKFEDTTFLFTDNQIVQEEFLEDISNILNSGEVPDLFKHNDLDKMITACRPVALNLGIDGANHKEMFRFFIQRVRSKLHLVVSMSSIGDAFRQRCRLFPSLIYNSTIDWFDDWPTEVLLSVAQKSLEEAFEQQDNPKLVDSLTDICCNMHLTISQATEKFREKTARHYYVTLKSYLEFLKLYVKMQRSQTDKIKSDSDRISYGLRKLYETFDMVGDMKTKLKSMAPALLEKNEATLKLMEGLTKEKASVDEVRKIVLIEETAAKMKASAAQEIAEDAQRDLTLAMPAMEAAKAALESLNKNDINELRLLSKPHKLVQTVMEAVCLLFGKKTDWTSAKTLLGDTNFLKVLQEYDTDSISDKMINQLKPYIEDPDFNPQKVATQSKVAKSMCMWVRAVHSYSLVYRIVEPKRKRQQEAEEELNVVLKELRTKQKMLADVEERLQKLEDIYDLCVSEKNKLEMNIEQTQSRLSRSDLLVAALSDEQQRWENNLKTYSRRLLTITGDTIIAAGSISYLGPFTDEYRKEITLSWLQELTQHNVRYTPNYSLSYILVDPSELRSWSVYGLPQDSVSTDSMIIATRASRWPLMIDPQGQANKWIKGFEADNSLRICKVTDSNDNLTDAIIDAIRLGGTVLIEGLDEHITPALKPVLENVTFLRDGQFFMRIGNIDVEYDNKFRFYMTTKIPNPHYLPDVWIQVTIVNFMVTAKGLEDQLLVHVVRLERPDLEDKRTEINLSTNNDNNLLKEMENKTLKMLYMSEGNILDDEELIDALNNNKESSIIVTGRLTDAEEMEKTINIARERYRAIAKRGSCLYFVVAQLSKINTMYQFSLNYFNSIFCNAIKKSNRSLKIDVKIPTMVEDITMAIYTNISRGLFEHHKLIFSFLLSVNIHLQIGKITNAEWNFLLYGPIGITEIDVPKKPMVLALSEDAWTTVNYMSKVFPKFNSLPENCTQRIQIKLGNFVQDIHLDPANNNSVVNWDSILNPFEKLMVIRALKEEKLICAISNFVSTELGKMFIESLEVSHRLLYTNTSSTLPLIYIISAGSDPFESFQKFSTEFETIDKLHAISLGQDQGLIAEKLIKRGKEKGDWVFLQNCHLAPSWMPQMENLVQELIDNPLDVNQNFRLFLSSMPSEIFPTFVLQNSLKVAHEPPKGLRAKMKKSFAGMNVDFFEDNAFGSDWRKMVFGLCFFHAIILERKKFGSLGWNVPYLFSDSDHEYGMHLLQTYCLTANEIPWDALQYIMVEINYGGRVNDYWDQKTMKTIFLNFFDPRTLEPNYKYSDSGIYFCPETENCTTINNYQAFINKLPIIEDLDIFGMHKNANIAYQTRETQEMLQTIVGAYSKSLTGVASKPDDEIVIDVAVDISKRLINSIDFQQAHLTLLKSDEKGRLSPLSTVLLQEIGRFNTLLDVMHNSLTNLREAIKGHQIMSTGLEEVYRSFMKNTVPTMWQNRSYPSLKTLGSWIKDLILRLDFINIWTKFGSPPSYWISGLYFPQGFITGCLQRHARKNSIPVYSLKIDFEVTNIVLIQEEISAVHATSLEEETRVYKGLTEREDGIYVHGLFLDTGRIDLDSKRLVDPIPGDLYSPLPVILLMPSIDIDTNSLRYNCPVYITTARAGVSLTTGHGANFLIGILLPTDFPENYWTLKGTALIAQITN